MARLQDRGCRVDGILPYKVVDMDPPTLKGIFGLCHRTSETTVTFPGSIGNASAQDVWLPWRQRLRP